MQLNRLTDAELIQHAWIAHDPLTGTELEAELIRRLETAGQTLGELDPVTDAIENSHFEPGDMAELFAVLEQFHVDDIKTLRQKLERADKWYGIAEEAGDLFQRLTDLTNTTL